MDSDQKATQQPQALRLAAWLNEGAWHKMTLGDVEAAGRELRRLHAQVAALTASQPAADEPDMYWDADEGERFGFDISDIISDYSPGDTVKIDCAKRLPSISVRVIENGDVLGYELISTAAPHVENPAHGPAPAASAVAGPMGEMAELSLLNRLIELGNRAAGAHATSNSDDGHKGTAAYVQWQEIRAEMGELIRAAYAAAPIPASQADSFQQRVQPWLLECFGDEIAADRVERNHRFLEEALELVQSLGCTVSEAHQLVDYVFGRPVGEPVQETGGVMVTLAALCLASGLDMHQAGETELARISVPELVAKIRAKQAAKPKHSPLPEAVRADSGAQEDAALPSPDAFRAALRMAQKEHLERNPPRYLNDDQADASMSEYASDLKNCYAAALAAKGEKNG